MKKSDESSIPWQYVKGMILAHAALVNSLIKSGAVTVDDVIKELDVYIDIFTEHYPDSIAIIETMKTTKNTILKQRPSSEESSSTPYSWLSDFTGHA